MITSIWSCTFHGCILMLCGSCFSSIILWWWRTGVVDCLVYIHSILAYGRNIFTFKTYWQDWLIHSEELVLIYVSTGWFIFSCGLIYNQVISTSVILLLFYLISHILFKAVFDCAIYVTLLHHMIHPVCTASYSAIIVNASRLIRHISLLPSYWDPEEVNKCKMRFRI